jgi:hypothetical protein
MDIQNVKYRKMSIDNTNLLKSLKEFQTDKTKEM